MRYILQRNNNSTQRSYGKYVAKAQHYNTVTSQQLQEEIQRNCSATVADCTLVMCELAETIKRHLQNGDKVELPYLGTAKLEILSAAVDDTKDFDPRKHIKGVRIHLLPKSSAGKIELYHGTEFVKL